MLYLADFENHQHQIVVRILQKLAKKL